MGLDFNLFGWVGDRFNDSGNGAGGEENPAVESVRGRPRGFLGAGGGGGPGGCGQAVGHRRNLFATIRKFLQGAGDGR